VEVQIAEEQLSDSDASTGNKSDKSPPHEQTNTQKELEYSEVTIETSAKDIIFFLL
jgi:hypothetical protein